MSGELEKPQLNVVGDGVNTPLYKRDSDPNKITNASHILKHEAEQNQRIHSLELEVKFIKEREINGEQGLSNRLKRNEIYVDELRTWMTRTTPALIVVTALFTLVVERLIKWIAGM